MIFVEMYGRLGNQMFRYAMARSLQYKFYPNKSISMNFSNLDGSQESDSLFYNEISNLNIKDILIYNKKGKILNNETTIIQKIVYLFSRFYLPQYNPKKMSKIEKKFQKVSSFLNHYGIYWTWAGYQNPSKSNAKNIIVSGNFESPRYFEDIREILYEEFTPKFPLMDHNKRLMEIIESSNSVCISVRRGDFVTVSKVSEIHSVVDKQYFEEAIRRMSKVVENPTYIVFSDDIEWVKENIDFNGVQFYAEKGTDPVWEKLRLMYSCKHFIISNSSFSWWAQYLGRYKDKIVISPNIWFNNDYDSELILESFITIEK